MHPTHPLCLRACRSTRVGVEIRSSFIYMFGVLVRFDAIKARFRRHRSSVILISRIEELGNCC